MMVWRQRHITAAQQHQPPPTLSLLQLNVPKPSDRKFKVLLAYNVHESLGI